MQTLQPETAIMPLKICGIIPYQKAAFCELLFF